MVIERQRENVIVLDLSGTIKIGVGEVALRECVNAILDDKQRYILLNFADVSSMDSAGIGELVACHQRVKNVNGALKLLNVPETVTDSLRFTRLDRLFEVYDDEEQALSTFPATD